MSDTEYEIILNLMKKGNFKQALSKLDSFLKEKDVSQKDKLLLQCQKIKTFNSMGDYEKALILAKEVREEAKEQKYYLYEIDALNEEIFANYRLNNIETAMDLIGTVEILIEKCNEKGIDERKAQFLVNKVYLLTDSGNLGQAFAIAQQNYYLSRNIKDESHLARAYYILGWVNIDNGDVDQAIENFEKSLEIREKLGNQLSLAYTLFILGFSWLRKGKMDLAQEFITRSLKIRKKIGNKQDIAWTLLNLGDIHFEKGDLKQAQIYYEDSLVINREIDYKLGIIFSLMRLTLIYEDIDNPQLVTDTLEKALYYAQEVENIDPEVHVLINLIQYATKMNLMSNTISNYLDRLSIINIQYPSKVFDQIYRLAKALVLKSSEKQKNKKKAHVIFQQITNEEIVNYFYTRIAMMNYSEILAEELKSYLGDFHLVNELTEFSDSISPIQFQQSYTMIAERFISLSSSALAEIDILKARELLKRAQYLCDFLELYKKGPTPFRIMFTLFIKERSLNELSEILNLTKGALTSQIRLLIGLNLVKISRERQVRSATILKKYYTIGDKAKELIKPFSMKIYEGINNQEDEVSTNIVSLMIPRLIIKMIQDTTEFINSYQHFLEDHLFINSIDKEISFNNKDKRLELLKTIFNEEDEIRIDQLFLTEKQYKTYMKLWKEFDSKVKDQILSERQKSDMSNTEAKSKYISHITLPIKELMMLERYQKLIKKFEKD